MTYQTIETEQHDDGVLVLTLDRPHRANAFNTEMAGEIRAVWSDLEADPDGVRCVVLRAAGEGAFCAGADLKERNEMSGDDWEHQHRIYEAMSYAIMDSPVPVIAAVSGAAIGGGLEIVLACDFAYGVPGARFGFPETRLGFMPGIGGTQLLPRRVGVARAREIFMRGNYFSAADALAWGLINRVCQPDELLDAVMACAHDIAISAPLAVHAVRRAASDGMDLALKDALELELQYYYALVETEDRLEGVRAFNEKRPPVFKGR